MRQQALAEELTAYEQYFNAFMQLHDLPTEWFAVSDHVAIKCANAADYTETCSELAGMTNSEGVWELGLDGRLLGSAGLAEPITFGDHAFGWIEIMQPRPGKEISKAFVEHTEFLYADFASVTAALDAKGIAYELQENPGHRWINIPIDTNGREVKINDKLLADVVAAEKSDGTLHPHKPRKEAV